MKVFYTPKQVVEKNTSFSPSAGKPVLVVESWNKLGIPIEIVEPTPCTPEDIMLAHSSDYVYGILSCKIKNGFSNTLQTIADSLPWTTGSFVSAAVYAVNTGETVASPTSGFHHADYVSASGFCTFNGLMIAAQKLVQLDVLKKGKVAILDCDMHYGDGTVRIMGKLDVNHINHWTFGRDFYQHDNAEAWLAALPGIVASMADCDVILYQAGADPHLDDPFGGELTTEQMYRRDQIVFKAAKEIGVPIAWNLAGGYQQPISKVLEIHDNTAKAHYEVYGY